MPKFVLALGLACLSCTHGQQRQSMLEPNLQVGHLNKLNLASKRASAGHAWRVIGSDERVQLRSVTERQDALSIGGSVEAFEENVQFFATGKLNPSKVLAAFLMTLGPAAAFLRPRAPASNPSNTAWHQASLDRRNDFMLRWPCDASMQVTAKTWEGWLEDRLGFGERDVENVADILPGSVRKILESDWPRADAASSEIQQVLNMSKSELRELVLKCPAVLAGTVPKLAEANLRPLQQFLDLSDAQLNKIVLGHPAALGCKLDKVKPRLEETQSLLGLNDEQWRAAVVSYPDVLSSDLQVEQLKALANPAAYHPINMDYPGLEVLYRNPDVFIIKDFLTPEECDRLIAKAKTNLVAPMRQEHEDGTTSFFRQAPDDADTNKAVLLTNNRASRSIVPFLEVPSIVSKITALTSSTEQQLEPLSVLRYTEGEDFVAHYDGFNGPRTVDGFVDSGRVVTVFVYLNDVDMGGSTRFVQLGLDIRPRKGTAVLHLPATTDMIPDLRTLHESTPAVDDKWLLTSWTWAHPKKGPDTEIPSLSDDII
mmetsp:Transcript_72736/g.137494  ORF Transcript_72736/g.137494 Transcript_72736/m.137494 type:complete len:540 (+) Transcript_72736:47-1666(+)